MMKSVEGAILKDAGLRLLERFIEPADPEDHVARNREAAAVDVPESGRISRSGQPIQVRLYAGVRSSGG